MPPTSLIKPITQNSLRRLIYFYQLRVDTELIKCKSGLSACSFVRSFVRSFARSFVRSLVRLFDFCSFVIVYTADIFQT